MRPVLVGNSDALLVGPYAFPLLLGRPPPAAAGQQKSQEPPLTSSALSALSLYTATCRAVALFQVRLLLGVFLYGNPLQMKKLRSEGYYDG